MILQLQHDNNLINAKTLDVLVILASGRIKNILIVSDLDPFNRVPYIVLNPKDPNPNSNFGLRIRMNENKDDNDKFET